MKKNIIFDNGDVLTMYEPLQVLRRFLSDEADVQTLNRTFYQAGYIRETDRGVMTHEEAIERVKDKLPQRLVDLLRYLYIENVYGVAFMPVFEEMTALVREVKEKGYGAYLLSNAGFDYYVYSKQNPAIAMMDGVVISCEYKLLKPERELYQILFDKYDLDPAECVFIDDMPENIAGANAVGLDGICFSPAREDVSVLREKLRGYGYDL